jgi:hypothetical protein
VNYYAKRWTIEPNFAIPRICGSAWGQGCSTLWNGQDFKQVIDARQSGAVAVLAKGAGLV